MGGRAAELVVFGQGSTGAANDLAEATALAVKMVTEFGLSPALGPIGYGTGAHAAPVDPVEAAQRPYSEHTQRTIDQEVARLLAEAEARAVAMLTSRRDALDRLAAQLREQETVDGDAVLAALRETTAAPAR